MWPFFRNESCLSTFVFILGKARFQVLLSVKLKLIIHKIPTVYQKQWISRPTFDEIDKIQIRFAKWWLQFCIVYLFEYRNTEKFAVFSEKQSIDLSTATFEVIQCPKSKESISKMKDVWTILQEKQIWLAKFLQRYQFW